MDISKVDRYVGGKWDDEIVPQLVEYIRIPNKSPMFDADWVKHGYMDDAVRLMETWAKAQPIPGMQVDVVRLEGRTPLIFIDIPAGQRRSRRRLRAAVRPPGQAAGNDRLGSPSLGPWNPSHQGRPPVRPRRRRRRLRHLRLAGRGAGPAGPEVSRTPRCVILIEACEESGSYDLPAYVDHLADRIGKPSLVVCLDSGCGNYDQLWCTTSLRGLAGGNFTVKVLDEGVHSGDASGIVPSSFRLLRQLLSRLEDEATGKVRIDGLFVDIPAERLQQAREAAKVLGTAVYDKFPFLPGMTPMADDLAELVLNRTWRPALSVTGVDGMPAAGLGRQRAAPAHLGEAVAAPAADAGRQDRRRTAQGRC